MYTNGKTQALTYINLTHQVNNQAALQGQASIKTPAAKHGTVSDHISSLGLQRSIGFHAPNWSSIAPALVFALLQPDARPD